MYLTYADDAFDWLQNQAEESADLIITDPPYASLEKHRSRGTTTRLSHSKASSNDWFPVIPNERLPALMAGLFRVLKPDRHCYIFCDQETMFLLKPIGERAGFRFWKPLIWDKCKIGMGYHYRARYEVILFFEKGKRKLNDLGIPDIITHPRVFRGRPSEKPYQVAEVLVKQSSHLDELVIDPFMGSGSVGEASLRHGRKFKGCDVSVPAYDYATERLARFA